MVERFEITHDNDIGMIHRAHPHGYYVRYSDYTALEAQLAERVKVKPLKWRKDGGALIARSPVGVTYEITSFDILFIDGKQSGRFWGDTEAAKAAAQADYERRALSALEATPPAPKVTEVLRRPVMQPCHCGLIQGDCDCKSLATK